MGLVKKVKKERPVGRNEVEVCMSQFAYNTMILVNSKLHNIFVLKSILRCFELRSRLKTYFKNIKIGGDRVSDEFLFRCEELSNCNVISLPFTYVKMPIGVILTKLG